MAASISLVFSSTTATAHRLPLSHNSASRMTTKSQVIEKTSGYRLRMPYELKRGQTRQFHELPSGLKMEVIVQKKMGYNPLENETGNSGNPPLVFVHGSFHAAWCWAEHWLPYFSQNGFDCFALSLLAQGESDDASDKVAGTLQTHAGYISHFIQQELTLQPVLIGHSFGGLIVQNYIANIRNEQILQKGSSFAELAGAVLVCSVPPSGNSGLVWRYLFSKPIAAFKVTCSLAAKAFQTDLPLCKETFFSSQMEDHLVKRYQELMKESSRKPLFDLRKLNASLPVPTIPKSSMRVLVLGANDDFIVDSEGLTETGQFYGVSPICIEGVAHDMMLDCCWENGADAILSWLREFR